jgi:hypothetical protein
MADAAFEQPFSMKGMQIKIRFYPSGNDHQFP